MSIGPPPSGWDLVVIPERQIDPDEERDDLMPCRRFNGTGDIVTLAAAWESYERDVGDQDVLKGQ